MKNNYHLIFLFVILLLNFSCNKPDITPAYLILSDEDFQDCIDVSDYNNVHDHNYDTKELDAIKQQNFTDVLVSLNGKELGYWQLPCTIPLLPDFSGKNNFRIIPCVRTQNTTETTLQYHFITPLDTIFSFMKKEEKYQISGFKLKYVPSVDFQVLETFTQSTDFSPYAENEFPAAIEIFYDKDLQKDIGKISLSDSASAVFFDVVTSYFLLQGQGKRYFWEISYKIDNGQMNTHLNYQNTITGITYQDMMVFPSTRGVWKKAYIDITEKIRQASNIAPQVSTRLRISGFRDKEHLDAYFDFENIKLITMDAPYY